MTRARWADASLWVIAALFVAMLPLAWVDRWLAGFSNWQTMLAAPLAVGAWWLTRRQAWKTLTFSRAAKAAFFAGAWVWLVAIAVSKWSAFEVGGVDFSIFDWMLHGIAHGRFGWSPIYDVNHFGVHPSWVLLTLVPVHLVSESPVPLLVVGASLYALGAWVLFRFAASRVGEALALLLALAFVTHPLDTGSLIFRPESFYPVLLLAFLWAWESGRPVWMAAAAAAVLCVKEDAAVVLGVFAIGEVVFAVDRRRAGAALLAGSVVVLAANLLWVQPALLSQTGVGKPQYLTFWSIYGDTPRSIVAGMAMHPLVLLKQLVTSHFWLFVAPVLFLPLWSRRAVFGIVPTAFILGSASYEMMHKWGGYYAAPIVPFLFYGLVQAANDERLKRLLRGWQVMAVALAAIVAPLIKGGIAVAKPQPARLAVMSAVRARGLEGLCAQVILFPHLGHSPGLRPWFDPACQQSGAMLLAAPGLDPFPFTKPQVQQAVDDARAAGKAEELGEGVVLVRW